MWADPAVYGPITGQACSREDIWQRLLRYVGHWQVVGYGTWYVRETATGCFVGEVGLMDSRRATEPNFEGAPEVGWALARWAHGQGFGYEALSALLAWADDAGLARTVCLIKHSNQRSIVLATKVGYNLRQEVRYRDLPVLLFERIRGGGTEQHPPHANDGTVTPPGSTDRTRSTAS